MKALLATSGGVLLALLTSIGVDSPSVSECLPIAIARVDRAARLDARSFGVAVGSGGHCGGAG